MLIVHLKAKNVQPLKNIKDHLLKYGCLKVLGIWEDLLYLKKIKTMSIIKVPKTSYLENKSYNHLVWYDIQYNLINNFPRQSLKIFTFCVK